VLWQLSILLFGMYPVTNIDEVTQPGVFIDVFLVFLSLYRRMLHQYLEIACHRLFSNSCLFTNYVHLCISYDLIHGAGVAQSE